MTISTRAAAIRALALACLLLPGCGGSAEAPAAGAADAADAAGLAALPPPAAQAGPCLPGGRAFLRARLRGAIDADLAWQDADMQCDGGPRPDGRGLRVTLAGPLPGSGAPRRIRLVFGIAATAGGTALPTNLTAIVEDESLLFATLGDDKCTTDRLVRGALPGAAATDARESLEVRGFCTEPASQVGGAGGRLLVQTFDFSAPLATGNTP